jgi:murein DD-endopeptidase MepM/ murein hydrolase activator NlpD
MRALLRLILALLLLGVIALGGAWFWAGRQAGPVIDIRQPKRFVGQTTPFEASVTAAGGRFSRLDIVLEQGNQSFPLFALSDPQSGSYVTQEGTDRVRVARAIGKRDFPALQSGPARIVVHAARPVLHNLRRASSTATREVEVRLTPPAVAVLSTFHYINHGGAEFVVFRATPDDVEAGVRVGEVSYAAYPAAGAGIPGDKSIRVAFFGLLYDQDLNTPISVYARDAAGNEVQTPLDHRPFQKPFLKSKFVLDDQFLRRVVPAIAATTPDMNLLTGPEDLLPSFLRINGELRRRNNATIEKLGQSSKPEMLWKEPFRPLLNAAVEARFADTRTYFYKGKEVDRQVHLGFDLAVTEKVPVTAAQRGFVIHASDLGIFGNCVILDHGLGVQSLYGHMSSIGVKVGDMVEPGQMLGRSGMTGLAGGDHVHFTMLVGGHPVNAVEWWDSKWMNDRVFRKIREAGGSASTR